jgi:hypothetical protein
MCKRVTRARWSADPTNIFKSIDNGRTRKMCLDCHLILIFKSKSHSQAKQFQSVQVFLFLSVVQLKNI